MAYIKNLRTGCHLCNRPAKVEVFDSKNVSVGRFCKSCAKRELELLHVEEARAQALFEEKIRQWMLQGYIRNP